MIIAYSPKATRVHSAYLRLLEKFLKAYFDKEVKVQSVVGLKKLLKLVDKQPKDGQPVIVFSIQNTNYGHRAIPRRAMHPHICLVDTFRYASTEDSESRINNMIEFMLCFLNIESEMIPGNQKFNFNLSWATRVDAAVRQNDTAALEELTAKISTFTG